jgi:glutaredoxin 3
MSVVIYTTPTCGYCRVAKDFFRGRNIPFSEYDVDADRGRAEEMVRKSGQMGVPVIEVNGKIIVGFNRPEIEKALNR